jgi:hypothetical protein
VGALVGMSGSVIEYLNCLACYSPSGLQIDELSDFYPISIWGGSRPVKWLKTTTAILRSRRSLRAAL